MKKLKEIHASFVVTHQTAKVMVAIHGACLVKMEKASSLWVEDLNLCVYVFVCAGEKAGHRGFGHARDWEHMP